MRQDLQGTGIGIEDPAVAAMTAADRGSNISGS
jgi:hypothetical protein